MVKKGQSPTLDAIMGTAKAVGLGLGVVGVAILAGVSESNREEVTRTIRKCGPFTALRDCEDRDCIFHYAEKSR